MRPVRVKSQKGNAFINHVLGHHPRHHGFAHAAFFSADQMNFVHIKMIRLAVEDDASSVLPGVISTSKLRRTGYLDSMERHVKNYYIVEALNG
jgi:hypothetical protein